MSDTTPFDPLFAAFQKARDNRFRASDQLSLGDIIEACEKALAEREEGKSVPYVCYDFADTFPTDIDSWRGSYAELALNYRSEGEEMKLPDFIAMLKKADGGTFHGYKGGEFTMSLNTPVWVANHGMAGNTAVVGVVNEGYQVILLTGLQEY